MPLLLLLLLLAGAAIAAPMAPDHGTATPVTARLLTPISSYHSKAGDPVAAVISAPVCLGGSALEADAKLAGAVERVHAVGLGLAHETASVALRFEQLGLADGRIYPIEVRLISIDNARERVDRRGVIHGIRATDTLSSRASARLFFLAHTHPALVVPSLAIESWLFHFPEPEFEYGVGTEFELEVTFPASLGHAARCQQAAPAQEDVAAWEDLVAGLPAWSYSRRQPQPMDPINLLFLGTVAELERAFHAAGWTGSQPNSLRSGFAAVRAIAEESGYADAPMRTLLLDGAAPDLQIQRSLNTFDKRDHMRIWRRDGEWQGRDIWAAAATRDLAATFSTRPFGFTHRIETDVDLERDKVVRELEFTGCVASEIHGRRRETAEESESRRGLASDGRVAVILLNSCENPQVLPSADTASDPPSVETRVIRRFTLTARNHFLRDNLVWRTGDALRFTWRTFQGWETEKRQRAARAAMLLSESRTDP